MKPAFRLAMRHEGDKWNAYVAKPDTMDGAIWIGSIAMRFVEHDKLRKDAFLAIMRNALADLAEEMTGGKIGWNDPVTAPEHERTKT
jgi:hypothetical protein